MNWKTTILLVVEKQSRTFLTDCRIRQRLVEFDNGLSNSTTFFRIWQIKNIWTAKRSLNVESEI
jgi:hypothetical protein